MKGKENEVFYLFFSFYFPKLFWEKETTWFAVPEGGGGDECHNASACFSVLFYPIISLSRNESAGGSGLYSDRWTTCRFCTICYYGMQLTAMNFFWRYLSIKVSLDIISFKILKLRSPLAARLENGLHGRRRCWPMAPLWCFYKKKSVQ